MEALHTECFYNNILNFTIGNVLLHNRLIYTCVKALNTGCFYNNILNSNFITEIYET